MSIKKSSRRRGRAWLVALTAMCLGASLAPGSSQEAWADEDRDRAAQAVEDASRDVDNLRSQIEGIDAHLADIFIELQGLNEQIPVAQKALSDAESRYEAARRQHEVALAQLESAQAEHDDLAASVQEAEQHQSEATAAIADLARQMYKNGSASAVTVALTAKGTASIDQRTAAAEAMSRSQSQALNAALDAQATQRSQVARQKAITERIAKLEATAQKASEEAGIAQEEARSKVNELDSLKSATQAKQAEWDSMKGEAQAQLKQAEVDYAAKQAELAKIDEQNRLANTTYSTSAGGWVNPVNNMTVTSPFGWRMHPVLGYQKFHQGVDFGAMCGDKIYAVADGTVSTVSSNVSAGNYIDVNHGMIGGVSTLTEYLHLQATYVSPGQSVRAGDVLGEVGMTGYSTGCHLHFGVMNNGSYVDPMNYF
ncbi:M23 family metallopeptidase [Schaalia vaccimaxillae]|uniref:M23 family metallopeptidase n=1 Tax=Schaalia vaccimaxillae TaxID=183916 RepID=UPI0003B5CA79|nr:M23 family metallopeptidase [Schaalia vaccimaxillae]